MTVVFDPLHETIKPRTEHIRVVDLTPNQLKRCRELSFGDEGYMCDDLELILDVEQGWRYRYSQAILLGDTMMEGAARLVTWPIHGWALLQPVYNRPRYSAQLFVDPDHRGKGYGKALLEQANRWGKSPLCYIDDENAGFFKKYPGLYEPFIEEEEDVAV